MFDKVLSMPLVLNIPGFWISLVLNVLEFWIRQGSKYASGFKYARILNTSEFWICLNISWLYLNMPDYVGICLNMPKYAWICLNLPEWLLFYIYIILHVVTYLKIFRRLVVIVWRNMRLFSWRDKFDFFYSSWKYYSFVFCFRLNIFTSNI